MHERDGEPQNLKKLQLERVIDGVRVSASVAPCAWMYPGHPLQVTFTLPDGDQGTLRPRAIPFERAGVSDVRALLDSVRLCTCTKCGNPTFDPDTVSTRATRDCRACVRAEFDAGSRATAERLRREIASLDAFHKSGGCTHRTEAWIHPDDGDDVQIRLWMTNPTAEQIRSKLGELGCRITSDFVIVAL